MTVSLAQCLMPSKLRYIVEGKTLLERLLWALVLTLAAAYTALSISKSLEEARANPIVTSVESVSVQELPFPAVSISHGRSNREQQKSEIFALGETWRFRAQVFGAGTQLYEIRLRLGRRGLCQGDRGSQETISGVVHQLAVQHW